MRITAQIVSIIAVVGLGVGAVAPAESATAHRQNIRITAYAKGVNRDCGPNAQKVFIVKAFVKKGSAGHFLSNGVGEIVLRSDRQLNADGYVVPPSKREVDFFFYPHNSGAKVKKTGEENSVTVVTSRRMTRVTVGALSSDCMEVL